MHPDSDSPTSYASELWIGRGPYRIELGKTDVDFALSLLRIQPILLYTLVYVDHLRLLPAALNWDFPVDRTGQWKTSHVNSP